MIRVAVLRGGPSSEYEVSLKTGGHVLSLLREQPDVYHPIDIFISKDSVWHRGGVEYPPHRALVGVDVVWNGLHGFYGEDGQVQRILERLHIPFVGSGAVASAWSMNKHMAKVIYTRNSLLTPKHELITPEVDLEEKLMHIFRTYLHPVIVKPANGGSSVGLDLVHSIRELRVAVDKALKHSEQVMVEEFIRGKEATCGVVENARGESLYALLPIEIKKEGHLFDYDGKYFGKAEEICPGNFTHEEKLGIETMAKRAHEALHLRDYSRSDFIITPRGKIYILETNSLPGFTQESLIPKSLHAVGWHPRDFVSHCLELALNR